MRFFAAVEVAEIAAIEPNLYEMVDERRDFAAFAKEVVERNH